MALTSKIEHTSTIDFDVHESTRAPKDALKKRYVKKKLTEIHEKVLDSDIDESITCNFLKKRYQKNKLNEMREKVDQFSHDELFSNLNTLKKRYIKNRIYDISERYEISKSISLLEEGLFGDTTDQESIKKTQNIISILSDILQRAGFDDNSEVIKSVKRAARASADFETKKGQSFLKTYGKELSEIGQFLAMMLNILAVQMPSAQQVLRNTLGEEKFNKIAPALNSGNLSYRDRNIDLSQFKTLFEVRSLHNKTLEQILLEKPSKKQRQKQRQKQQRQTAQQKQQAQRQGQTPQAEPAQQTQPANTLKTLKSLVGAFPADAQKALEDFVEKMSSVTGEIPPGKKATDLITMYDEGNLKNFKIIIAAFEKIAKVTIDADNKKNIEKTLAELKTLPGKIKELNFTKSSKLKDKGRVSRAIATYVLENTSLLLRYYEDELIRTLESAKEGGENNELGDIEKQVAVITNLVEKIQAADKKYDPNKAPNEKKTASLQLTEEDVEEIKREYSRFMSKLKPSGGGIFDKLFGNKQFGALTGIMPDKGEIAREMFARIFSEKFTDTIISYAQRLRGVLTGISSEIKPVQGDTESKSSTRTSSLSTRDILNTLIRKIRDEEITPEQISKLKQFLDDY